MDINSLILSSDIASLSDAWSDFLSKWLGPCVLAIIACFCIKFLISREWTKFLSFLALALIIAVVVFFSDQLFKKDSGFVKAVKGLADTASSGGGDGGGAKN